MQTEAPMTGCLGWEWTTSLGLAWLGQRHPGHRDNDRSGLLD